MDQGNIGQASSTKRSKRLAVKKLIIKIKGALAPCLKVAHPYRPGLHNNISKSLQSKSLDFRMQFDNLKFKKKV